MLMRWRYCFLALSHQCYFTSQEKPTWRPFWERWSSKEVHFTAVPFSSQDELARVFVTLFDAKHLLYQLLWNMFSKEVEIADCMQTLFRGNSLASKIMAFCFKIYGQGYLCELLNPLIMEMFESYKQPISYEVDPARLESGEQLEMNRKNLIDLTQKVFNAIVASSERYGIKSLFQRILLHWNFFWFWIKFHWYALIKF